MKSKVKFLGYIVNNPERFRIISEYPRPTDNKSVSRFLGICSFCAEFIPDFATMAEPLNKLKRKVLRMVQSVKSHSENSEIS